MLLVLSQLLEVTTIDVICKPSLNHLRQLRNERRVVDYLLQVHLFSVGVQFYGTAHIQLDWLNLYLTLGSELVLVHFRRRCRPYRKRFHRIQCGRRGNAQVVGVYRRQLSALRELHGLFRMSVRLR